MKLDIKFINKPIKKEIKSIFEILNDDGLLNDVVYKYHDYCFFIKNENNEILGGALCQHIEVASELYILSLAVNLSIKRKGFGKKLIQKIEELAKKLKCDFIIVNTFEYQAKSFYEKYGFKVEFMRKNKNPKLNKYYLRRDL